MRGLTLEKSYLMLLIVVLTLLFWGSSRTQSSGTLQRFELPYGIDWSKAPVSVSTRCETNGGVLGTKTNCSEAIELGYANAQNGQFVSLHKIQPIPLVNVNNIIGGTWIGLGTPEGVPYSRVYQVRLYGRDGYGNYVLIGVLNALTVPAQPKKPDLKSR